MPKHHLEYLKHILDEIKFILENSKDLTQKDFLNNDVLKRAFVRSLEIIGEATKKLPNEFKEKYKHVDWKSLAAARDKLIHHYFGVDYEIVWDIVTNEIPPLKDRITEILRKENK